MPNAPPTFVGPGAEDEPSAIAAAERPERRPLGRRPARAALHANGPSAPRSSRPTETSKRETLPFGGDRLGRDVLAKAIKGAQISILVGVSAALLATLIGTVLGALGGFFGGKVGDLLEWVYNVFTSIPGILLIFAFAAVFGRGVRSVVLILGLTGWTGIYRLVRAEFIKHAVREYVRAAEAIGASALSRMFRHILPNVSHVVLVQLSILRGRLHQGRGDPVVPRAWASASTRCRWGTMLAEAQSELILGHWWQLAAATLFMAVFVTAFSLMTDALRDALDPKLRGLE